MLSILVKKQMVSERLDSYFVYSLLQSTGFRIVVYSDLQTKGFRIQ